jgi:hypothetical protein
MTIGSDWLSTIVPFVGDAKMAAILREKVGLIEAQRDDAISLLDKADAALAKSEQKVASLEVEVAELKEQLDRLQPAADLSEQAAEILQYYFQTARSFSAEHIAKHFGLTVSVGHFHCDTLRNMGLIEYVSIVVMNDYPRLLKISEEGRAFVMERGLA